MPCTRELRHFAFLCVGVLLSACGGGGGGGGSDLPPATAPTVTLKLHPQRLELSWAAVSGATHYRLLESVSAASTSYVQIGGAIAGTTATVEVAPWDRLNASYIVEACNAAGCKASAPVLVSPVLAREYLKASNTDFDDYFGFSVALSADGTTLAVGAINESSGATGIDGDQHDNFGTWSGAVYVFTRSEATTRWSQHSY